MNALTTVNIKRLMLEGLRYFMKRHKSANSSEHKCEMGLLSVADLGFEATKKAILEAKARDTYHRKVGILEYSVEK